MKLLVFGEAFVDTYLLATAERISPEAPIPVAKVYETFQLPGGAGNVVENLQVLGGPTVEILQLLFGAGFKNRLIVGGHQLARWDVDDYATPFGDSSRTYSIQQDLDGVIISDYGKGMVDAAALRWLARLPKVPIFIDTKANPDKYSSLPNTTFFPNHKEYLQYKDSYNTQERMVHKHGAEGMEYVEKGQPLHFEQARTAQPVSVIGAGDTVLASYAYAMVQLNNPRAALSFASAAAAAAVSRPYTTAPSLEEISKYEHN